MGFRYQCFSRYKGGIKNWVHSNNHLGCLFKTQIPGSLLEPTESDFPGRGLVSVSLLSTLSNCYQQINTLKIGEELPASERHGTSFLLNIQMAGPHWLSESGASQLRTIGSFLKNCVFSIDCLPEPQR